MNGECIGGGDEIRMLEAAGKVPQMLLERLEGKITVAGRIAP